MKKFLSVTLSLLLAASMPLSALAETYDLAQGSITVEAKADGNQYVSQTGGVQQKQQTTETVINQTGSDTASTNNTITIQAEKNQTAQVTISDVNIDVSGTWDAAISAEGDGNVTIELDGNNTAKGGSYHAGVEKNNGGNLTITDADGDGALNAKGGVYGAGIGGGRRENGSNITISGNAEVEAVGGTFGAGIGGGHDGNGSNITISGSAEVTANGGKNGAGIGGGNDGSGSDITISGSAEVTANGNYGAGIGGGDYGSGSNIKISDNAEVTANGGGASAGIGGGYKGSGSDITISGSAGVTAKGGNFGAGIGGGYYGSGSDITISGNAEVITAGGENGAGIGGGPFGNGEITPNSDGLTNGFVAYYDSNANMETSAPKKLLHNDPSGTHTHTGVTLKSSTAATCTTNATVTYLCSCGAEFTTELLGTAGHKLGEYTSNNDATCEQDGTKTAKCVRYGQGGCTATDTVTDVGSKLNHDFQNYVSNGDATCEQDGTKTAKCVRFGQGGCTATDTVPDAGSKLGHDFTDYIYNNNASYTEDGTETAHCNHIGCNETHTRKAEGTRWALFQVKDEKGWYITYAESRSGSVLTITVNQNTATLSGTIAGLRVLQASGITTVIFKTTEAESTFHIADLLSGTSYNLSHKNTAVDFTLDGNDIAALLK